MQWDLQVAAEILSYPGNNLIICKKNVEID